MSEVEKLFKRLEELEKKLNEKFSNDDQVTRLTLEALDVILNIF